MSYNNVFFSIIVPFFNTNESYFKYCINSIKNQSFKNFELIVIDNSDKKDSHILAKNICTGINVRLITTQIIGVSNARNIGIENSFGKYIIFVDSDDYLPENALLRIYKNLVKFHYPDVIIGKNLFLKNNKFYVNKTYFKNGFQIPHQYLIQSIFLNNKKLLSCADTPWAKIYKKDLVQIIKFDTSLSNGEDGLFNYQIYKSKCKIYFLDEIIYCYRFNPYSTCASKNDKIDELFANLYNCYKKKIICLNSIEDIDLLYGLMIRNLLRVFRKKLAYCLGFQEFELKLKTLLNKTEYKEAILYVNKKHLSKGQKFTLKCIKNKLYYFLFFISKLGCFKKIK